MLHKMKRNPKTEMSRVADHPDVVAAKARLADLRAKAATIRADIEATSQTANVSDHQAAVLAVFDGGEPQQAARDMPSRTQLEQLRRELSIVQDAIKLAEQALEQAHRLAHDAAVESMAPAVRDLFGRTAKVVAELAALQAEAIELDATMQAAGIKWPRDERGPLGLAAIGDPSDDYSLLATYLALAAYAGVIDEKAVPPTVRETATFATFMQVKNGQISRADMNGGSQGWAMVARSWSAVSLLDARAQSVLRQQRRSQVGARWAWA
ncbi:MAG TPA: hypothetical protein PJ986_04140 [Gammaproteobacteria bacterium]|nr:hypothetical protein [Gammaproteobacteria bacterium]